MTKDEFKLYLKEKKVKEFWSKDFYSVLRKNESDYSITHLFQLLTGILPNTISFDEFDAIPFTEDFIKDFEFSADQIISYDYYSPQNDRTDPQIRLVLLSDEIIFLVKPGNFGAVLYFAHTVSNEIVNFLKEYSKNYLIKEVQNSNMYFITSDDEGALKGHLVCPPDLKNFNFDLSYNDDFFPIHDVIVNQLKVGRKGIIMLHGTPGSGKTTYIRYLMHQVTKKFLILSSDYAHALCNKEFIKFLLNYRNTVLIIEDAESAIQSRTGNNQSATANLLNLTDGLLSDALGIQVIVTFNNDITKIDSALMRKGRMIARYEFGKLEKQKAQKLSDYLGIENKITEATILADIYNKSDINFSERPINQIGFK